MAHIFQVRFCGILHNTSNLNPLHWSAAACQLGSAQNDPSDSSSGTPPPSFMLKLNSSWCSSRDGKVRVKDNALNKPSRYTRREPCDLQQCHGCAAWIYTRPRGGNRSRGAGGEGHVTLGGGGWSHWTSAMSFRCAQEFSAKCRFRLLRW